jgi:hypothetical protein
VVSENERQESGNRKQKTGKQEWGWESTGFEFPVAGSLFSIFLSGRALDGTDRGPVDRQGVPQTGDLAVGA